MYKGKKILALITARGGSKGLPGKNIRPLLGKPLIAWSIEQAKRSAYIDKIAVSTDNQAIAKIAKHFQAEVPFIRPKILASDRAKSIDVIEHAVKYYNERGDYYDYLVLLEPTSPLREEEDIDRAIINIISHAPKATSMVSVAKLESAHPAFSVSINKRGLIIPYLKKDKIRTLRRQELTDVYYFEGTIYISLIKELLKKRTFYHDKTMAYIVQKWQAFEVDDIIDFICIEALIKHKQLVKRGK
jgi:CMP-N-acetylneuraminic acid synthetase